MPRTTTATKAKPVAKNLSPKADEATLETFADEPTPIVEVDFDDMFPKLSNTKDYMNILAWGREGSAKTTLACSMANFGTIIVINAEGGLKKKALARRGINVDNIRVWPNPDNPVPLTRTNLDELHRQLKAQLTKAPGSIYGVVLDSASEITDGMVAFVSDNRIQKLRDRGQEIDDYDAYDTDRNDYGVMGKHFRDIARKFRDLPCHFVMTALERRDVDEDTGLTMYGPAVSPGLQKDLLGYVDLVFYMRQEDEEGLPYRALTKKMGKFRAKDRLAAMPKVLAEPTFERILDYDDGKLVESEDPIQLAMVEAQAKIKEAPKKGKKPIGAQKTKAQAATTDDNADAKEETTTETTGEESE